MDLDHDGDLDLLLVGGTRTLVYRNNLDGTFTEVARDAWASPAAPQRTTRRSRTSTATAASTSSMATDSGVTLYHNTTARDASSDATASSGLPRPARGPAVTVADYDNDGTLDLFVARRDGAPELWRNDGNGQVHAR